MIISNSDSAQIISRIEQVTVSAEVKQLLTELVETDSDIFKNAHDNFVVVFYNVLSPKVRRHEVANLQTDDPRFTFVQECIRWAIDNWVKYTMSENIQRSILVYSLLDYFNIPDNCLDWANIDLLYVSKIEKALSKMSLSIIYLDNAPYNEKKAYEQYLDDVKKNRFGGIISFLNRLRSYQELNIFLASLIKIAFRITPQSYALLLSTSNKMPLLVKSVIEVLDETSAMDFFVHQYAEKGIFPLVYFFDAKVRRNSLFIDQKEISESKNETSQLCLIFGKIIDRLQSPTPVKSFIENLNLSYNDYFHLILGSYIANNIKYLAEYVNTIDFDLSQSTGTHFWQGFIEECKNDEDLVKIAVLIEERYYGHCQEKKYVLPHQYTSYLNFVYKAIQARCSSADKYYSELLQIISNIRKVMGEWKFSQIAQSFHKMFLAITCNAVLLQYSPLKGDSLEIMEFLSDNRLKAKLGEEVYTLIKKCLVNPFEVSKIVLCDHKKMIEITINRRNG